MTYVELSIQSETAGAYELGTLAIGIASRHVECTWSDEILNDVIGPGLFQLRRRAAVEDVRVGTVLGADGGSQFLAKGGRENGARGLVDTDFVLIRCSLDTLGFLRAQPLDELFLLIFRAFPAITQVMP